MLMFSEGGGVEYFLNHSSRACKALPKQQKNGILCLTTNSTCTLGRGAKAKESEAGLVLVESLWKPNQRPYKQKLAFLLTSMRHFALEAAKAGHRSSTWPRPETYAEALEGFAGEYGPLTFMRPAERELRCHLGPLVEAGILVEHPHEGWLTTPDDFLTSIRGKKELAHGQLLPSGTGEAYQDSDGPSGQTRGRKLSYDAENRKAWKGDPPAPEGFPYSKSTK